MCFLLLAAKHYFTTQKPPRNFKRAKRLGHSETLKQTIVITGAAQGLGLEIAKILYKNHYEDINLVLIDIRADLFKIAMPQLI